MHGIFLGGKGVFSSVGRYVMRLFLYCTYMHVLLVLSDIYLRRALFSSLERVVKEYVVDQ